MNEDIPIYSIVLLKIVAVVQVTFGLVLTFAGSFFLFTMMTNDVPSVDLALLYFSLYFFLLMCIGLFIVYAGVQSLRVRLSVLKWILLPSDHIEGKAWFFVITKSVFLLKSKMNQYFSYLENAEQFLRQ